jgi:hypothetical protein
MQAGGHTSRGVSSLDVYAGEFKQLLQRAPCASGGADEREYNFVGIDVPCIGHIHCDVSKNT